MLFVGYVYQCPPRGGGAVLSPRIMSEPYLSTVLEEAERVAEQHDQIARSTEHPAHEYLRYAVLRLLEGEAAETAADVPEIDGVTVSGSSTLTSTKSSHA